MQGQDDPDALIRLAQTSCQQGRFEEGIALVRQAMAADPRQARAHVLLGMALAQLGSATEALASFDAAIACQPDSADAHGNRGDVLLQLGRLPEALGSYRRALDIRPNEVASWCNLAAAQVEFGQIADALASYDRVIALDPAFAEAHVNRGHVLNLLGRIEEAADAHDAALRINPHNVDALAGRAGALTALKRPLEALKCLDVVIEIEGASTDALSNRGFLLHSLHRYEEALGSLDRAIAADPNHAEALGNRGVVLSDMGRHQEALASFDRVLAASGASARAHCNRAKALLALNRNGEALESAQAALTSDPEHVEARYMRGFVLTRLSRHGDAIADFERVLELAPQHPHALAQLLSCCLWICDWSRLEALLPRLPAATTAIVSPHILLQLPLTPAEVLERTRRYVEFEIPMAPPLEAVRPQVPGDRLRIAYLSSDFRVHPTSYLIAELFERHDRSRFEIIGVSFGPDDRSEIRTRITRAFDRFHDVRTVSDREIAQLLQQIGVHIAVDLNGHIDNSRPGILRSRPTPVQAHYLGYPGTMGADFIDYVIADGTVAPAECAPFYAEKIVQLPDCYQVNDRNRAIAERTPLRSEMGLPDKGFVFCCFNNNYKITAPQFDVWMRLLAAISGSVLWLLHDNAAAQANLRRAAAARGVDPERLVFATRMKLEDHLARHRLADLFLDTLPCNAHTTASDALWAGLPVVTLRGDAFVGRVAASILHAAGLPELVTETIEDYEALALALAREPARLAALRQKLARNRLTCPLFDTDRFRRHLEAAYVTMWQTWQRGEAPRGFAVAPIETSG